MAGSRFHSQFVVIGSLQTLSIHSFLLFRLRACNASCWVSETIGGMSLQLNPDLAWRSVMRDIFIERSGFRLIQEDRPEVLYSMHRFLPFELSP
jgi:hypothetical protein